MNLMDGPPIVPIDRQGHLELSYAQQRLWFLDQLEPDNAFNNIPIALLLVGELNVSALEKSLNALVARHETLRTGFGQDNGKPIQNVEAQLEIPLTVKPVKGDGDEGIKTL